MTVKHREYSSHLQPRGVRTMDKGSRVLRGEPGIS